MSGSRFLGVGSACLTIVAIYACGSDDGVLEPSDEAPDAANQDGGRTFTEASTDLDGSDDTVYPPSSLALGDGFSCLVASDHTVWCWGKNDAGQLGSDPAKTPPCGSFPCTPTPTKVEDLLHIRSIALGKDFACAIDRDNRTWCWGDNSKNQIVGHGVASRFKPEIVADGAQQVVAQGQRACILDTNGFIHCWGDNTCNLFLQNNGEAGQPTSVTAVITPQMQQISLGTDEMCTVTAESNGQVYCWGNDHNGSLGHPLSPTTCNGLPFDPVAKRVAVDTSATSLEGVADVHVGTGVVCAHKTDGSVVCWGDNTLGALGQGYPEVSNHMTPVAVPAVKTNKLEVRGQTACVIVAERLLCWGDGRYGQMDTIGVDAGCGGTGCRPLGYVIPGQLPVRDVFLGPGSIGTIKTDLSVWVWGKNDASETGTARNDSANVTCASSSKCIPSPHQITTGPTLQ